MEQNKGASVTVFFTLIFLSILSLVGTMIEVSRYQIGQVHTWRTLECATASLFTEYNRPLYDEYRLFLLEDTAEPFEKTIATYMNDTLDPRLGKTVDLLEGSLSDVKVESKQYAGDKGGRALLTEITEFMKRKLGKDALSKILNQRKEADIVEETAEEIKDEVEEQEEAAELDISTLELMKLIDGVEVSSNKVKAVSDFAKMIVPGKKAAAELGIYHPTVWETISPKVMILKEAVKNRSDFKKKVKKILKVTKEALEISEDMKQQYKKQKQKAEGLMDYYSKMNALLYGDGTKEGITEILSGNIRVLEQTKELLDRDKKATTEEIEQLWRDYRVVQISFDYEGLTEEGGKTNPKDILSDIFGDGFIELVVKKPEAISENSVEEAGCFESLYDKSVEDCEDYDKKITDFLKEDKVDFGEVLGGVSSYATSELCLDKYIQYFFGNYQKTAGVTKKKLKYEMEYILVGKESDKENLTGITERLLLVRSVANLITLAKDSVKRNQAYTMAVGIVGFTAMEPLIRLTQTLLLIAWSIEEGLVDVAALVQGKEIPLFKSSMQIQIKANELLSISRELIQRKAKKDMKGNGTLNYENYLTFFLMGQDREVKLYRLMDLIQWNMNENYSQKFSLVSCVYAIEIKATVWYQAKFFRMTALEKMLGRSLKQFSHTAQLQYRYGKMP